MDGGTGRQENPLEHYPENGMDTQTVRHDGLAEMSAISLTHSVCTHRCMCEQQLFVQHQHIAEASHGKPHLHDLHNPA
jgi:hypothetical protein